MSSTSPYSINNNILINHDSDLNTRPCRVRGSPRIHHDGDTNMLSAELRYQYPLVQHRFLNKVTF